MNTKQLKTKIRTTEELIYNNVISEDYDKYLHIIYTSELDILKDKLIFLLEKRC